MPKFEVYAPITGTKYIGTYEVETAEKAIELAEDDREADVSPWLCHHCAGRIGDLELGDYFAEVQD